MPENRTRRDEIYDFIVEYAATHNGPTPTIREIATHFSLAYTTIYDHVQRLELEGRVEWRSGKVIVTGARWIAPDEDFREALRS